MIKPHCMFSSTEKKCHCLIFTRSKRVTLISRTVHIHCLSLYSCRETLPLPTYQIHPRQFSYLAICHLVTSENEWIVLFALLPPRSQDMTDDLIHFSIPKRSNLCVCKQSSVFFMLSFRIWKIKTTNDQNPQHYTAVIMTQM